MYNESYYFGKNIIRSDRRPCQLKIIIILQKHIRWSVNVMVREGPVISLLIVCNVRVVDLSWTTFTLKYDKPSKRSHLSTRCSYIFII